MLLHPKLRRAVYMRKPHSHGLWPRWSPLSHCSGLHLESTIKMKGSQAHAHTNWIPGFGSFLIMGFPNRGGVESAGSKEISSPRTCPPDINLSKDRTTNGLILYALPAAKEALHFFLFFFPSNCFSVVSFLIVTLSHIQVGEAISLYGLRILWF